MADMMNLPSTFREFKDFIERFSFTDDKEIYTNGAQLIPVSRVMQAYEGLADNVTFMLENIQESAIAISDRAYDAMAVIDWQ